MPVDRHGQAKNSERFWFSVPGLYARRFSLVILRVLTCLMLSEPTSFKIRVGTKQRLSSLRISLLEKIEHSQAPSAQAEVPSEQGEP